MLWSDSDDGMVPGLWLNGGKDTDPRRGGSLAGGLASMLGAVEEGSVHHGLAKLGPSESQGAIGVVLRRRTSKAWPSGS